MIKALKSKLNKSKLMMQQVGAKILCLRKVWFTVSKMSLSDKISNVFNQFPLIGHTNATTQLIAQLKQYKKTSSYG